LVRHGEGEGTKEKWQTPDTPLSERGRQQSERLAKVGRFNNVDKIFSSSWPRALETAEIVTRPLNKPIEVIDGIQESGQSSRIYGLSRTDPLAVQYNDAYRQNLDNWDWSWDREAESLGSVAIRAAKFKNRLLNDYLGQSVLVFSHETFLRSLMASCVMGDEVNEGYKQLFGALAIENTGVSMLIYLEDRKTWKLWYINDYSHGI
jgi:broad specificity phosphatase PhoE